MALEKADTNKVLLVCRKSEFWKLKDEEFVESCFGKIIPEGDSKQFYVECTDGCHLCDIFNPELWAGKIVYF